MTEPTPMQQGLRNLTAAVQEANTRIRAAHLKLPSIFTQPARQVELDLSEPVEMIEVKGWRLQFEPSRGEFRGRRISRVFVTIDGELGRSKHVCRARYGPDTVIFAGAALHVDSRFGDWHD